jgi:hypothetical protein
VDTVDDGQLQICHAALRIQGKKRPIAVERNDIDARQPFHHRAVHNDQRSSVGNSHQRDIVDRVWITSVAGGVLFKQRYDRPTEIRIDFGESADDLVRQCERDEPARSIEFRWSSTLGRRAGSHRTRGHFITRLRARTTLGGLPPARPFPEPRALHDGPGRGGSPNWSAVQRCACTAMRTSAAISFLSRDASTRTQFGRAACRR